MAVRIVGMMLPAELLEMVEKARNIGLRTRSEVIQERDGDIVGSRFHVPSDEGTPDARRGSCRTTRGPRGSTISQSGPPDRWGADREAVTCCRRQRVGQERP